MQPTAAHGSTTIGIVNFSDKNEITELSDKPLIPFSRKAYISPLGHGSIQSFTMAATGNNQRISVQYIPMVNYTG
jgi:hypothetical protein